MSCTMSKPKRVRKRIDPSLRGQRRITELHAIYDRLGLDIDGRHAFDNYLIGWIIGSVPEADMRSGLEGAERLIRELYSEMLHRRRANPQSAVPASSEAGV